ncbi:MAG: ribosomal protein S18-alanine N-acetyltransferase [Gemmatimonadota bacterium]|nr:ribosomal protein S18-alanine N-acetyltransferase [Gemmatimonadota bacterium]
MSARAEGPAGPSPHADILLRPMRSDDLPAVMHIERTSYTQPWEERSFRALMRRPSADLTVAEADGAVAGFSVTWTVADEAELGNLAVADGWRRRGVGRALLAGVVAHVRARGVRALFLEVRESNEAARRLYEREGFRTVGRRRRYYALPVEDAIVMKLEVYRSPR